LSLVDSKWLIGRAEEGGSAERKLESFKSGSLTFSRSPNFLVTRESATGGYDIESDSSGWWMWSPGKIRLKLIVHGKLPAVVSVKGSLLVPGTLTNFEVRQSGSAQPLRLLNGVTTGWQTLASVPFTLDHREIELELYATGDPRTISDDDQRKVLFLLKNLRIELVGPALSPQDDKR
jgi:hypothetical protein